MSQMSTGQWCALWLGRTKGCRWGALNGKNIIGLRKNVLEPPGVVAMENGMIMWPFSLKKWGGTNSLVLSHEMKS